MSEPRGIPSLNDFLDSLQSAEHGNYVARVGSRVAHEEAFSDMKAHILRLYEDVEASHSFMDESGAILDCIPIEQQPAPRGSEERVPAAPDLFPVVAPDRPPHPEAADGQQDEQNDFLIGSPLSPDRKDWHGNVMYCPEGTIPMRRVTLEDLTRFETLQDFFRKSPRGQVATGS